jgi:hypothetical protein
MPTPSPQVHHLSLDSACRYCRCRAIDCTGPHRVASSAAVIGLAKKEGLVNAARPLLEQTVASGYLAILLGHLLCLQCLPSLGSFHLAHIVALLERRSSLTAKRLS